MVVSAAVRSCSVAAMSSTAGGQRVCPPAVSLLSLGSLHWISWDREPVARLPHVRQRGRRRMGMLPFLARP